ncbi:MAG TPA: sporulation initiation phosphotransferase B [Firmicutes bacterium]|nr:Spo0B domain-containing protein [Bacillales bacterium]HJA40149.1 sporulation initiation phosphotransferase B [Bacillota bacterium]
MRKQLKTPLELLRYTRHDWLNRLQIIQGQLYLGNIEKVQQYISEILEIEKASAYFSHLGCEKTALLFLTHNWRMSPIVIQLKGEGMPANWEKWDEALCQFSAAFIQLLEVYGDLYEVNQLYITADGMNIYFDYSGKLSQVGAFQERMQEILPNKLLYVEYVYVAKEEMSIQLQLK